MEIISDKRPIPKELQQLQKAVKMMDSVFRIPGTKYTFGIDPLLNLIPYAGSTIGFVIGAYLLFAMQKNGASSKAIGKMIWNITLDAVIGVIPIVGTLFDFAFKANKRNMILAVEHFEEGKHQGSIWPYLLLIAAILIVILVATIYATIFVLDWLFNLLGGIAL